MFTGIIKDVGTIRSSDVRADVETIELDTRLRLDELPIGASIAIDGVCLTQTERRFEGDTCIARFDIGPETRKLTTLKDMEVGRTVHLEPALRYGDALDGHMVSGHVDAIGTVIERIQGDETLTLRFEIPENLMRYVALKGSIAIDGTSLTINDVRDNTIEVTLIPHTLVETHFGKRQVGDSVNIEVDTMARYLDRLATPYLKG